jgi:phosphatidylglycerophosphate synthase
LLNIFIDFRKGGAEDMAKLWLLIDRTFPTAADKMTATRVVTTALSLIFYFLGWYFLILPCDLWSVYSDWKDGRLAIKYGSTKFGARFDAAVDKFFTFSKIYMIWDTLRVTPGTDSVIYWMERLVACDVSLFFIATLLYSLTRAEIKSNWFGKKKFIFECTFVLLWAIAFCNPIFQFLHEPLLLYSLQGLLIISTALAIGSFIGYLINYGYPYVRSIWVRA